MRREIERLLKDLGDDHEQIAAKLLAEGCKGWKGDGDNCPVADYLRKNGYKNPSVCTEEVTVEYNNELVTADVPLVVEDFLHAFDDGNYPALERQSHVKP